MRKTEQKKKIQANAKNIERQRGEGEWFGLASKNFAPPYTNGTHIFLRTIPELRAEHRATTTQHNRATAQAHHTAQPPNRATSHKKNSTKFFIALLTLNWN